MVIKGYAVGPLLKRTGKEILADGVPGLAAQTAYYFFFSLFPLFLFLAPLLGVFGDKRENFGFVMGELSRSVPGDAFSILRDVVANVVFDPNAPGIMSMGAVLAIWSGSNIFSALMGALNKAYDVKESRPWWKQKVISVLMVIGAGIIMLVATVVLLGGEDVVDRVSRWVGLGATGERVWKISQFPIALVMLVALSWAIYYFLPNLRQRKSHALVGAIFTTILWILMTLAFRLYVQNFANYDKTYGTIGGVIMLLTWMFLSMFVVLIGGELAAELHHGTGAIEGRRGVVLNGRIAAGGAGRPSTERVGPVQPMTAQGDE